MMMKRMSYVMGVLLGLALSAVTGHAMNVEEAYRAIPHQRTVFDSASAKMNDEEKRFLSMFFGMIDEATVYRVEALLKPKAFNEAAYQDLLRRMRDVSAPAKLEGFKNDVLSAVDAQRAYLALKWRPAIGGNKYVSSASGSLHSAYGRLMSLYPEESSNNRQAFFDYLCALDFV